MTDNLIKDALDWSIEKFGDEDDSIEIRKLLHLKEEVDETITAISNQLLRADRLEEYTDCLILLLTSARKQGFKMEDFEKEWVRKMEVNKNRKWGEPNEKGYTNHIK